MPGYSPPGHSHSSHDVSFKVSSEQKSLLNSRNFTLRPLSSAGTLGFFKVFENSWQPIVTFLVPLVILTSEFRRKNESVAVLISHILMTALLVFPAIQLAVLFVGAVVTKLQSRVRWHAVVFWMWWPLWKLFACVVAAVVGTMIGNYLWSHFYFPTAELEKLQVYDNLDVSKVSGVRVQDAGVVTFANTSDVARQMTGCLKNGATFCVAPIVPWVVQGFTKLRQNLSQYDLFMAGTDCCSCPGEFRCGDWTSSSQNIGGLRVIDPVKSRLYTLAAQDFAAGNGKVVKYPIFFEWNNEAPTIVPDHKIEANQMFLVAFFGVPLGFGMFIIVINGLLQILCEFKYASPIEPPVPPAGLISRLSHTVNPRMHQHYVEEQAQLNTGLAPNQGLRYV
eukprot:TRINITY_DN55749_c0_g1_i1.p1 TRINITY_DN55749_c0_g1~~TRINITY_DN55749_c0_g1_i1.p1  ORF type:complete len:392 (+),score=46.86 TRINITY_DN55749_c0_g1_i1:120-1295(+)